MVFFLINCWSSVVASVVLPQVCANLRSLFSPRVKNGRLNTKDRSVRWVAVGECVGEKTTAFFFFFFFFF